MRAGFTEALRKRLRRGDDKAKVIVQSVVVQQADQLSTQEEWDTFDLPDPGVEATPEGTLILDGGTSELFNQNTDDGVATVLGPYPEVPSFAATYVAEILWDVGAGGVSRDFQLDSIEAELDPNVGGAGQEVDQWVCQLFTFAQGPDGTDETELVRPLGPLSGRVYAAAGGAVARVTFDFTQGTPVRPAQGIGATVIVAIWGIQEDGTPAANCGWRTDSSQTSYTLNGHIIRGRTSSYTVGDGTQQNPAGVTLGQANPPNIRAVSTSYVAATAEYTTNPLTLATTPTNPVEFGLLFTTPAGSSLTAEVRNDADTAWVEFNDGDTTDDLAGVGLRTSYAVRFTLTPGTGTTPILSRCEIRELQRTDLQDIATVRPKGSLAIDPITLRGEIMEYDIHVVRDGRRDFLDYISDELSTTALADIELEIYVGHPDLARQDWLLVDRALVDDHTDELAGVTLNCLSVHRELEQPIPQVKGTTTLTSDPLAYPNTTLKAVWDDILANQVDIQGRYVGPGVENTSVNVNNILERGTARRVLDDVAYIAGGGVIASQGQIQYRSLYDSGGGIRAVWPKEETTPQAVTPGARYRTPRISILYGFNFNSGEFQKEYQAQQDNVVDSFGITALRKAEIPESVGKWVTDDATAATLCERVVESIGDGLILWSLRTSVPYPELEPGDLVAVEVEEFLAKDPNAARAIKGSQLVIARITAVADVLGTEFDVWVQSLSDIIPTNTEVDRTTINGSGGDQDQGALGLSNFRVGVQGSTFTRYQWDAGALVDNVEVFNTLVSLPSTGDPWPSSTETPTVTITSTQAQQYDVAFPSVNQARYLTYRPYTAGGVAGPIQRRIIQAPLPPVIDVDFAESPTVGTLWLSAKGLGISSVLFSRKSGRNAQSTFATATRVGSTSTGAPTSVVKGGTLGPGEYEQDVTLANDLNSFIRAQVALYSGDVNVYGPYTFDAGQLPNILSVSPVNRQVTVTGDTDVQSLLLKRVGGSTWARRVDGTGFAFNVSQVSTNGAAGMGSTELWNMRAVAFNVGKGSASTSAGAKDTVDVVVTGENYVAGADPMYKAPRPTAFQPQSTGDDTASLILAADQSSTAFEYRVEERFNDNGSGFSTWTTANLNPSPNIAVSTNESTYARLNTGFPFDATALTPTVEWQFRCTIVPSTGGAAVDTQIASASWAYSTGP